MQSQTKDMFTELGPYNLRLRSSSRGDLHYHTGFSTLTRKTFTPHNIDFQRSSINIHNHSQYNYTNYHLKCWSLARVPLKY